MVEYSLSVDNIFVFVLVLGYFGVPARYQHRVLFYGILGALIFRGDLHLPGRDPDAVPLGRVALRDFPDRHGAAMLRAPEEGVDPDATR